MLPIFSFIIKVIPEFLEFEFRNSVYFILLFVATIMLFLLVCSIIFFLPLIISYISVGIYRTFTLPKNNY
jgi:hypothetical protein